MYPRQGKPRVVAQRARAEVSLCYCLVSTWPLTFTCSCQSRIRISITAVAVPNTGISRTGITDCEVRCHRNAPGNHPSMSIVLFASILKQDPDDLRQTIGTEGPFVDMCWGFDRGAMAQFETRLVLVDDASGRLKFTHGLEHEIRLDRYMKSIPRAQSIQQHMTEGMDRREHQSDAPSPSTAQQGHDRQGTTRASSSTPQALCDGRRQSDILAERLHDTQLHGDTSQMSCQSYVSPPDSPVSSGFSFPADLDQDQHHSHNTSGEYHFGGSYQPDYGRYLTVDGSFSPNHGCCQPGSTSCRTEDGSYLSEDEFFQPTEGSDEPGEGSIGSQLERQLLEEVQYRQRRNMELQFR